MPILLFPRSREDCVSIIKYYVVRVINDESRAPYRFLYRSILLLRMYLCDNCNIYSLYAVNKLYDGYHSLI